jgi:hypothetical protein
MACKGRAFMGLSRADNDEKLIPPEKIAGDPKAILRHFPPAAQQIMSVVQQNMQTEGQ